MAESTSTTWGEACELRYGKALRDYKNGNGDIPVYGTNGPVGWCDKAIYEAPSVIVGRKGAYRGIHFSDGPFFVIDTAFYLVPKPSLDPKWAYYNLLTVDINGMDSGSAIPSTSRDEFYRLPLKLPSLHEQQAIANVLGALDDKIENNRRMNETLEEMARAIFKSWFVDFDPVHAKARGEQPAHMDAETAALFPSSFGEDGLPDGWPEKPICDLCNVRYGAPFSSKHFNEIGNGRPLIRIRDLPNHSSKVYTDEIHKKETTINSGDIVVGMDGEFRSYLWQGAPSLMNQRVCMFVPNDGVSKTFLKFGIDRPLAFFERGKVGTTVIHLAKKDIDTFKIIYPSVAVMRAYANLAEPLTDKMIANSKESQTLAILRDTLLPKLMSGEIRLKDAEKEIGAAV